MQPPGTPLRAKLSNCKRGGCSSGHWPLLNTVLQTMCAVIVVHQQLFGARAG
jgi:hypothetical protein